MLNKPSIGPSDIRAKVQREPFSKLWELVVLALVVTAVIVGVALADESSKLTKEQILRAKIITLQEQLASCNELTLNLQNRVNAILLGLQKSSNEKDREALTQELLKALNAGQGDTIDFTTDPPSLKKGSK